MNLASPLDTITPYQAGWIKDGIAVNYTLAAAPEWPAQGQPGPRPVCWPCDHYRLVTSQAVLSVTFTWLSTGRYPATRTIDYCHSCAVNFCRKRGIIPPLPRKLRGPNKTSLRMYQSCIPDDPRYAYVVAQANRIVYHGSKEECEMFIKVQ